MREKFIDLLGNDEMKEAVGLLGGDLKFQLDWMFGEGTDWESVKEKIQAADEPGRAAVREDVAMRGRFIDLLGDDEMKEAVELLGGDLRFKLDWMLREGTTWAIVKPLIEAADETAKAGVRDDPTLRSQFVELLGDDEMAEAVQLLGGDLYFKLSWTLAEGTTWTAVRALLEAADEPGKARVRGDLGMRGWFVENLGDDEMAEAVSLLGGDLVFKLGWTLAEGTTWEKAKTLIEAAPQPERAAVLNDQELFDRLVGLVGNQQMQELLDLLGADLATRVRWLIRNGTDAAALTAAIHAATPEQQMGLIADSMLGQVLEIVPTNGIDLFTALTDAGRFATAMNTPLMVTELLAKPAAEVLTKLAGDPATARAAMEHMDADLSWMSPLPTRTGLSTAQRAELRVLFDATQVVTHRWKLIERRFGIDLSGRWGSTLHPGDLGRLWTLMERLPDSHIEDNSKIDNFIRNFEGGGSYGGVGGGNTTIGADGSHVEPFYADAGWKTGPDMAAFLGVPETELPGRVTSGQLETQNPSGTVMYRVKQISMLYFDHTVLHEVAHAVDDMLGKHTSIVYDWAGWEKFSEGDVRTWANHMGGWGTTRDGDDVESVKRSICSYMDSFMDNSSEIGGPSQNFGAELDASHPVKKYSTWPIVQRAGTKMFHYVRPHAFDDGSHVYIANYYYQEWYRVKSTAVAYIPRDYTRFSPDEWFADMYAEYYRQYDGTPATENLKGGNCPGAVKTWFDANVDALGRSPQTVAPSGTAPAHTSGVSGGRR
jgi:hypothetical protein